MAAQTAEGPQRLEARLRGLADALRATDNEHPLLEVAHDACYFMTDLITKDRGHSTNDRGYRGFYKVVQDIIKLFENRQNRPEMTGLRCKLASIKLKKKCSELRRELKREFKNSSGAPRYTWENGLVLAGGVVSTLSGVSEICGVPGLKPVGTVLQQLGELVKTLRGNMEEINNLLYLATRIFNDLSAKIQDQMHSNGTAIELTEELTRHIEAFGRILNRIRGYVEKLGRKTLAKRCLRVSATKEDLAGFRKELMDVHMIFMTSSVCAIRLEVHGIARSLNNNDTSKVKEDLVALRDAQTETITSVIRVDNAVQSLSKAVHDGDAPRVTREDLAVFRKEFGDAQTELVTNVIRLEVDDAFRSHQAAQVAAAFKVVGFLYGGLGGGASRIINFKS
ncbi:hypothetical protein PM082_017046 [Marasmius tenuissimus]|nr:hypothetical protein PM082_017046 [Marasmius tenuissimus]